MSPEVELMSYANAQLRYQQRLQTDLPMFLRQLLAQQMRPAIPKELLALMEHQRVQAHLFAFVPPKSQGMTRPDPEVVLRDYGKRFDGSDWRTFKKCPFGSASDA